jgi:hypothetical protein
MDFAFGYCSRHSHESAVVILKWQMGKRVIIVSCPQCKKEMLFELEPMLKILGRSPQSDLPEGVVLSPGSHTRS